MKKEKKLRVPDSKLDKVMEENKELKKQLHKLWETLKLLSSSLAESNENLKLSNSTLAESNKLLWKKIRDDYKKSPKNLKKEGFWVTDSSYQFERKINIIKSMSELNDMGWGIISLPSVAKTRKQQRVDYVLSKISQFKFSFIKRWPIGHHVKYDVVNKQIQLNGQNAGPNNCGPWIRLEKRYMKKDKDENTHKN